MTTNKYIIEELEPNIYIIHEGNYNKPIHTPTFSFDTETITFFNDKIYNEKTLYEKTKKLNMEQKRKKLKNITWAWQVYDEYNGFFMTNNFDIFIDYCTRARYKYGWCYNSTFDFAQIDYQLLINDKWKRHDASGKKEGKAYNKGQPYTYESLHNEMGARYSYKLWVPYRNENRHIYTRAFEIRDFNKIVKGSLAQVLEDFDVANNEGVKLRKLSMEYQEITYKNYNTLTQEQINYCNNDVMGLYFAIKTFNKTLEELTNNELHIYGKLTNVMTAGGIAKSELLRSLYPNLSTKYTRLKKYQKEHPITLEQDNYYRNKHLYKGGISFINPYLKGKLLTSDKMGSLMYRYDVNSEYPFSMASINDLVGEGIKMTYEKYKTLKYEEKQQYEAIYIINALYGQVKNNMLGVFLNPFTKKYEEQININDTFLIFEREFNELLEWYDNVEFEIKDVILYSKGNNVYAPFINKYYDLKAKAKKENNKVMQTLVKLILNSSYGKLAERLERVNGHYEISKETNAVHFVKDSEETSEQSKMSVVVGSLITAYARIYILSSIRRICVNEIKSKFLYIDTDSIHAFKFYKGTNNYKLGALKLEMCCEAVKYIAPKSYIDIEKINKDGTIDFINKIDKTTIKPCNIEIHCKGLNVKAVYNDFMKRQKGKKNGKLTLDFINSKIEYGQKYKSLQSMNVKGGKCLLLVDKYIAREELRPNIVENEGYFNEI